MPRRSRLLALIASIVGVTGLMLAPAAAASATAVGAPGTGSSAATSHEIICDQDGNGLCLNDASDSSAAGNHVNMAELNGSNGEIWTYSFRSGSCNNGYVVAAPTYCPFTQPALDQAYSGDPIFWYPLSSDSDMCLASNPSDVYHVVIESCGSTGTTWVQAPNPNGGAREINIHTTNVADNGYAQALTGSSTSGAQARVVKYDAGVLQAWIAYIS